MPRPGADGWAGTTSQTRASCQTGTTNQTRTISQHGSINQHSAMDQGSHTNRHCGDRCSPDEQLAGPVSPGDGSLQVRTRARAGHLDGQLNKRAVRRRT
ncbi:hypothetical protein [Arthrobacter sp. NicSoilB8]|uniref:hypothetical protein n=1 Tax=Arthrobacter sp. NicSoilB8 TaxID=2830998 RepID=UPI001CC5E021|nr:hypothetical protein [Arthrobacter sp. NicSoilB8]